MGTVVVCQSYLYHYNHNFWTTSSILMFFICFSQVDKAFDHIMQHADCPARNLRFHVMCNGSRGIYLREATHLHKPSEHTVTVDPIYAEDIGRSHRQIIPSFWFAQWTILEGLEYQFHSCAHTSNLSSIGPPNSTTRKGPDNHCGEDAMFDVLLL